MRRLGLVLLAVALAGFLFASAQRKRYAAAASAEAETVSAETMAAARWESARWLLVGMGVIGAVFTVLPGKRAGSAVNFGDSRRKTS